MTQHIDSYISLISPWSYLGGLRLTDMIAKTGASVTLLPVQMPALLENTGGVPFAKRSSQRLAYRMQELARWRDKLGVPIRLEPAHFPTDETKAAGAVIAAGNQGSDALALAVRLGKAIWEDDQNIAEDEVLAEAAHDVGLDANALLDAATGPAIAERWAANTEQAIQVGVFGVPTYVLGADLYWGQDRLDFVEHALTEG